MPVLVMGWTWSAAVGGGDVCTPPCPRSLDSAAERAAEAAAKLKDFGEEGGDGEAASARRKAEETVLPSAFAAFNEVQAPPSFLDPEATRQLTGAMFGRSGAAAAEGSTATGSGGRMAPGAGFDISVLAPKVKGQKRPVDSRDMPASALIESKARRYKDEGGPEASQQYSALTVIFPLRTTSALHESMAHFLVPPPPPCDHFADRSDWRQDAGPPASLRRCRPRPLHQADGSLRVPEQRHRGGGAASAGAGKPSPSSLPSFGRGFVSSCVSHHKEIILSHTLRQDRKDKEKEKRAKGQSAIGSWKTEAEMVCE